MTKREAAVVMAYTGYAMLMGDDLHLFYEYLESIMGGPVQTIYLADDKFCEAIRQKAKPDFIDICKNLE